MSVVDWCWYVVLEDTVCWQTNSHHSLNMSTSENSLYYKCRILALKQSLPYSDGLSLISASDMKMLALRLVWLWQFAMTLNAFGLPDLFQVILSVELSNLNTCPKIIIVISYFESSHHTCIEFIRRHEGTGFFCPERGITSQCISSHCDYTVFLSRSKTLHYFHQLACKVLGILNEYFRIDSVGCWNQQTAS